MTLIALTILAAAASHTTAPATAAPGTVVISRMQIERSSIVRVRPAIVAPPNAVSPPVLWREKKGPKCIQVNALAGALVSSPNSVDLFLRGGPRLRAKLERSCTAIDFYQGFYVKPSRDGRICEDRDAIRSRLGAECEIKKFRTLVPDKE